MSKESQPKRRSFSDQFKRDAVDLVVKQGYSFRSAAKSVGVGEGSLRLWHRQLAPTPQPAGEDASLQDLREENQRLRRELRKAELEREILKKATAYFAKESQ